MRRNSKLAKTNSPQTRRCIKPWLRHASIAIPIRSQPSGMRGLPPLTSSAPTRLGGCWIFPIGQLIRPSEDAPNSRLSAKSYRMVRCRPPTMIFSTRTRNSAPNRSSFCCTGFPNNRRQTNHKVCICRKSRGDQRYRCWKYIPLSVSLAPELLQKCVTYRQPVFMWLALSASRIFTAAARSNLPAERALPAPIAHSRWPRSLSRPDRRPRTDWVGFCAGPATYTQIPKTARC